MTTTGKRPTVLAVDDEPGVLGVIEGYLEGFATVRTATSGEEALERIDDAVDIVLLDRLMPDLHGDEVLEAIRSREYDCGVIMVSAVQPDVDIATIQYNEYLVKPIGQDELREAIRRVHALSDRDIQVQEYFALADKIHALEDGKAPDHESREGTIEELRDRMDQLSDRINPPLTQLEEQIADNLAAKWPQDSTQIAETP